MRPSLEDEWYEFNDTSVKPKIKDNILKLGYGGAEVEFEYEKGKVFARPRNNMQNAYMLVYMRDQERSQILKEIDPAEIPPHLKDMFDEENLCQEKLTQLDSNDRDCRSVFLISQETQRGWDGEGFCRLDENIYIDEPFQLNHSVRLELLIKRRDTMIDFLTRLRRFLNRPLKELLLYKVYYDEDAQANFLELVTPEQHS